MTDYQKLLRDALEALQKAINELTKSTNPETPMPRPRFFDFAPPVGGRFTHSVRWPYFKDGEIKWDCV